MNASVLLLLTRLLDAFPVPAGVKGAGEASGLKGTAGTRETAGPAQPARPAPILQPLPAAPRFSNPEGEDEGQATRLNLTSKAVLSAAAGSRAASGRDRAEEAPARPEGGRPGPVTAGAAAGPSDTAILLPLALKSPLFREAGFYLVLPGPDEKKNPDEKTALTLLLVLKTAGLGVLRLFFLHRRDSLQLSWLTQTETAKEELQKGLGELKAELCAAGYASVTMAIRVLPEKTGPDPGVSPSPGEKAASRASRTFDRYV